MALVVVTPDNVRLVFPESSRVRTKIALVAITQGLPLYEDPTTGKVGICDANDAGKEQFCGISLNAAGPGQAVDVCEQGELEGFTLTGNYKTIIYVGDAVGTLDTASGTKAVQVGKVCSMSDPDRTKVLRVFADPIRVW